MSYSTTHAFRFLGKNGCAVKRGEVFNYVSMSGSNSKGHVSMHHQGLFFVPPNLIAGFMQALFRDWQENNRNYFSERTPISLDLHHRSRFQLDLDLNSPNGEVLTDVIRIVRIAIPVFLSFFPGMSKDIAECILETTDPLQKVTYTKIEGSDDMLKSTKVGAHVTFLQGSFSLEQLRQLHHSICEAVATEVARPPGGNPWTGPGGVIDPVFGGFRITFSLKGKKCACTKSHESHFTYCSLCKNKRVILDGADGRPYLPSHYINGNGSLIPTCKQKKISWHIMRDTCAAPDKKYAATASAMNACWIVKDGTSLAIMPESKADIIRKPY